MELFKALEKLKTRNCIEDIPLLEIKKAINNDSDRQYDLKLSGNGIMLLVKKDTNDITNIKCVKNYYNKDINGTNIKRCVCGQIMQHLRDETNKTVDKCEKCHLYMIEQYYNNEITKG